ncbi:L,D-transpeptidase family protein [Aurantiacibacter marinus]|uniref:L,D-transpeptidase family protein n=1 Tax=Aurantiacibacter marinus TaxID=874156 RepID=UPI00069B1C73|nr:L,D-transpeptidase family protein [Aurantiacibacter marinus]
MRIVLIAACIFVMSVAPPAQAVTMPPADRWDAVQAEAVWHWLQRADHEAITIDPVLGTRLRTAIDSGDRASIDQSAQAAAMRLLLAYHGQCCSAQLPGSWHISQPVTPEMLADRLNQAVANDQISLLLRASRPRHPQYLGLARAYANESDADRRANIALNLARWRSLPLPKEGRYIVVNTAAQELTVWDGDRAIDRRRVIAGTRATPTPVFAAQVSGVVLNPWWNIPASIAAEGIGSFVRRDPAGARARGYIYSQGRYRQMPGDNNALGRMKLVMPNRFSVFLHDTSNRELFGREERLLSHGCVRVQGAIEFASLMLEGTDWTRAAVDEVVDLGETTTIPTAEVIPIFVAYFTAEADEEDTVQFLPDVYSRDGTAGLIPRALRRFAYPVQSANPIGCNEAIQPD